MSISDKAIRALENLGLTRYEIKAYVALIEYGPMTAAEISRHSGVPYSKIYDVLSALERKGWVEAERVKPSRFYPRPPNIAVETTRMRLESEWRSSEGLALRELMPIYEKRGAKERPDIWIIRGIYNILVEVRDIIRRSESELMIALPSSLDEVIRTIGPQLLDAFNKGVKVVIMAQKGLSASSLRALARYSELVLREQMFGGGVISDARELVLLLGGEDGSSAVAIRSDHTGLARLAREYFEYLWKNSEPYRS